MNHLNKDNLTTKTDVIQSMITSIEANSAITQKDKVAIISQLNTMNQEKVNILITGATGAGKSSTINALFNADKAKVGQSSDPETMDIKKYELNNLVIHDSPGLGDGIEKDRQHAKGIINKLNELDDKGNLLIDLVLVIVDGGTRDMGTTYELINKVIIPNLGKDKNRLIVAVNRADMAMSGQGWDFDNNKPLPELVNFLEGKIASVQKRIKDETNLDVTPIYYAAGFKLGDEQQCPYNLSKLLLLILRHTKKEKRVVYANERNQDEALWQKNDEIEDYNREIHKTWVESIVSVVTKGAEICAEVADVIIETTSNAISGIYNAGKKMISSLASGIGSFFSSLW